MPLVWRSLKGSNWYLSSCLFITSSSYHSLASSHYLASSRFSAPLLLFSQSRSFSSASSCWRYSSRFIPHIVASCFSTFRSTPQYCYTMAQEDVFVGAIDQGTTSSRFLIFNKEGEPVAEHQEVCRPTFFRIMRPESYTQRHTSKLHM